jgi:hypothetical protein
MTLSNPLLRAMNMPETAEVFVPLVHLSHPDLSPDLYLVANGEAVVHGGQAYVPMGFELTLPDDVDAGIPVLKWQADAVNQQLVIALRSVTGSIDAVVKWVLVSSPDVVELGPYEVELRTAEYDAFTVGGPMTIAPILDEPFGYLTITPSTFPAEF